MNLSQKNFLKGSFNFRSRGTGELHTRPRYSYETKDKLYDVIVFRTFNEYQVNGKSHMVPTPIHLEILKHFSIESYGAIK